MSNIPINVCGYKEKQQKLIFDDFFVVEVDSQDPSKINVSLATGMLYKGNKQLQVAGYRENFCYIFGIDSTGEQTTVPNPSDPQNPIVIDSGIKGSRLFLKNQSSRLRSVISIDANVYPDSDVYGIKVSREELNYTLIQNAYIELHSASKDVKLRARDGITLTQPLENDAFREANLAFDIFKIENNISGVSELSIYEDDSDNSYILKVVYGNDYSKLTASSLVFHNNSIDTFSLSDTGIEIRNGNSQNSNVNTIDDSGITLTDGTNSCALTVLGLEITAPYSTTTIHKDYLLINNQNGYSTSITDREIQISSQIITEESSVTTVSTNQALLISTLNALKLIKTVSVTSGGSTNTTSIETTLNENSLSSTGDFTIGSTGGSLTIDLSNNIDSHFRLNTKTFKDSVTSSYYKEVIQSISILTQYDFSNSYLVGDVIFIQNISGAAIIITCNNDGLTKTIKPNCIVPFIKIDVGEWRMISNEDANV